MAANSTHVKTVTLSQPYAEWAEKYPVDASKISRRLAGERTTEPGSLFGAGLARAIVAPPYMPGVKTHVQTVIRSQPYQEWAAVPAHLTDHNKVMRRLAGQKTTEPSSNLAKGLARLLYQPVKPVDPEDPPPPPPPGDPVWPANVGFMHDLWKRHFVFTRALSSFHGVLRAEARDYGWTGLAVHLDGTSYADANEAELKNLRPELTAKGWEFVGWATYGQGNESPFDEGRRQAAIAKRLGLAGWIANGEAWAESADAWKTPVWIDGWMAGGGEGIPVACSCLSSTTGDWAREFDYQSWITRIPGSAIFPQVYGATYTSYTVANAVETLKRGRVPRNRVGLTFDVIDGLGPFPDYRTWDGCRQIWTGDDARPGTFAALAR